MDKVISEGITAVVILSTLTVGGAGLIWLWVYITAPILPFIVVYVTMAMIVIILSVIMIYALSYI